MIPCRSNLLATGAGLSAADDPAIDISFPPTAFRCRRLPSGRRRDGRRPHEPDTIRAPFGTFHLIRCELSDYREAGSLTDRGRRMNVAHHIYHCELKKLKCRLLNRRFIPAPANSG